ncbi:hypothetical protein L2E82_46260 [Cichorium intybus]|uniref:Uncharacterized protein n=1 Tax=Cichorium intybus TaxID=13427 RepID=A0ACB8YTI4_CICIN|nr:hypothetical protein L2E82_46260 [Cichorium intybus]
MGKTELLTRSTIVSNRTTLITASSSVFFVFFLKLASCITGEAVLTFEVDDSGGDVIWRSTGTPWQRILSDLHTLCYKDLILPINWPPEIITKDATIFAITLISPWTRQILTYLLISSGSSAATRVDDWKSNWGADKFPQLATTSVGLGFVAFVAFAFSSLISGLD